MKLAKSRTRKRGRIEIIPMIDVMFFLLATFMLASLSLQHLNSLAVNLPKGTASALQIQKPVPLLITVTGDIRLNDVPVTLDVLAAAVKPLLTDPTTNVVVAADSAAPHGTVIEAMLRAREAGADHFAFAIKPEPHG